MKAMIGLIKVPGVGDYIGRVALDRININYPKRCSPTPPPSRPNTRTGTWNSFRQDSNARGSPISAAIRSPTSPPVRNRRKIERSRTAHLGNGGHRDTVRLRRRHQKERCRSSNITDTGGGHLVHYESPEKVNGVLVKFLKSERRRPGEFAGPRVSMRRMLPEDARAPAWRRLCRHLPADGTADAPRHPLRETLGHGLPAAASRRPVFAGLPVSLSSSSGFSAFTRFSAFSRGSRTPIRGQCHFSYLPRRSRTSMNPRAHPSEMGPGRQQPGGRTKTRSTMPGTPFVEEAHQRLAAELGDGRAGIYSGIGPEGLGRGFHRLLVFGRKRAQGMLHAVAELTQYLLGYVQRAPCDEVHATPFERMSRTTLFDLRPAPSARH